VPALTQAEIPVSFPLKGILAALVLAGSTRNLKNCSTYATELIGEREANKSNSFIHDKSDVDKPENVVQKRRLWIASRSLFPEDLRQILVIASW
jgi:hypothetical protein